MALDATDACGDCHCRRPGWHKLWCPRALRSMQAMARRLAK